MMEKSMGTRIRTAGAAASSAVTTVGTGRQLLLRTGKKVRTQSPVCACIPVAFGLTLCAFLSLCWFGPLGSVCSSLIVMRPFLLSFVACVSPCIALLPSSLARTHDTGAVIDDDEDAEDNDDDDDQDDDEDDEEEDGDDDLHDMDDMEDDLDGDDQDDLDGHDEDEDEDEDDGEGDEDEDMMEHEDNFFEIFQPYETLVYSERMSDLTHQHGGSGDGRHGGGSRVDASTRSLAAQLGATTSTRAADGMGLSPADLVPLPILGMGGYDWNRMGMQAALANADPSLLSVLSRVDPRTLLFALGWDPLMGAEGGPQTADFRAIRAQMASMPFRGDIGGLLRQASGYADLDGGCAPATPVDPSTRLHRALCRSVSSGVAAFPPRRLPPSLDRGVGGGSGGGGDSSALATVYRNLAASGIVLPPRASGPLASSLTRGGASGGTAAGSLGTGMLVGGELGGSVPTLLPNGRGSMPNGLTGLSASLSALAHYGPGPFGCDGGGLGQSGMSAADSSSAPSVRRGLERLAARWRYEPPSVVGHAAELDSEGTPTEDGPRRAAVESVDASFVAMLTTFGDADSAMLSARDAATRIRQDLAAARERVAEAAAAEAASAEADAARAEAAPEQPAMDASPSTESGAGGRPMSTATDEGDALAARVGAIGVVSPMASPGGPSAAGSNAGDDAAAAAARGASAGTGDRPDTPAVTARGDRPAETPATTAAARNPSGTGTEAASAAPAASGGTPAQPGAASPAEAAAPIPAAITDGDFTAIGLARASVAGISMSAPADDTPRVIEAATEATGVDPTFLSALPSDMRLELLNGLVTSPPAARATDGGDAAPAAPAAPVAAQPAVAAASDRSATAAGEAPADAPAAAAAEPDAEARRVVAVLGATSLNPDFLAALPPDLRGDALTEEARHDLEQHNRHGGEAGGGEAAAAAAGGGGGGLGGDGVGGMGDMDNATFLATLGPALREEILVTSDAAFLATLPPAVAAEARLLRQRALSQQRARLAAHTWTDNDGRVHGDMDAGIPIVAGVDDGSVEAAAMFDARAAYMRRRGRASGRDAGDPDDGVYAQPPLPLPHLDAAALGAVVRLLVARDAPRTMVHRVLTGACRVPSARDEVLHAALDLAEARATGSLSASAEFRCGSDGAGDGGIVKMHLVVPGPAAEPTGEGAAPATRGPGEQRARPKVKVMAAKSESADAGVVVRRALELLQTLAKDNEDVARALASPTPPDVTDGTPSSDSPAKADGGADAGEAPKGDTAAHDAAPATAADCAPPAATSSAADARPPFMARLIALLTSRLLRRSSPTIELLLSLLSTVCHAIPPAAEDAPVDTEAGGDAGAGGEPGEADAGTADGDAGTAAAASGTSQPPAAGSAVEEGGASNGAADPTSDASRPAASTTADDTPAAAPETGGSTPMPDAGASDSADARMQDDKRISTADGDEEELEPPVASATHEDADPAAARVPRIADKDVRALVDVVRRAGCTSKGYVRASGVLARLGERRAHEQVAVAALCEAVLATGARVASTLDRLVSRIDKVVADQPDRGAPAEPRGGAPSSATPSDDGGAAGAEVAVKHSPAVAAELRRFSDTPASDSELALLRLLMTLDSLLGARRAAAAANPQESDAGVTSAAALDGLQHLWNGLTSLLDAIRGKDVRTEEEEDESKRSAAARAVATVGSRPKGARSALPPALARLAPLIEAYFRAQSVMNTSGAGSPGAVAPAAPTTDAASGAAATSDASSADAADPLARQGSSSGGGALAVDGDEATASQTTPLGTFINRHRAAVNAVIRANPSLLDGSLRSSLSHPQALDFDNKRTYFRTLVRKRMSAEAAASGGVSPLRIRVRRDQVFQDSYHQLRMRSAAEMKGRLHVQFIGEEGIDAGGVTREWYALLARKIFDANHALFVKSAAKSATYQPNVVSYVNEDHLGVFKFAGRVFGKAILDGQLLDAYFTRAFYKHLLGVKPSFSDVEALDPDLHSSLTWVLNNDPAVLDMTMSAEHTEFGTTDVVDLIPDGRNIPVTNENKAEYVRLITDLRLTKAIRRQIDAFLSGFRELIPGSDLTMFNEVELELLMAGLPDIDVADLKGNVEYTGYTRSSAQVDWFWTFVSQLGREDLARLVMFVTGTSKIPIEGFAALQGMNGPQKFHIHRVSCASGPFFPLPSAHTCFNTLDLPQYPTAEVLNKQLLCAIREGSEGFGFA